MVCSSCNKQKAGLTPKKSRLIPSMLLYMCDECIRAKREPRFVIIIAAQDAKHNPEKFNSIRDYVKNRRYVGEDILGREIL